METRDREWESSLIRAAAEIQGLDPWTLIVYAGQRADEGAETYGDVGFLERDLPQEALDEIADCVNYIVWAAQKSALSEDVADHGTREEFQSSLNQALRASVQLWDSTRTVNRLSKEMGLS